MVWKYDVGQNESSLKVYINKHIIQLEQKKPPKNKQNTSKLSLLRSLGLKTVHILRYFSEIDSCQTTISLRQLHHVLIPYEFFLYWSVNSMRKKWNYILYNVTDVCSNYLANSFVYGCSKGFLLYFTNEQ